MLCDPSTRPSSSSSTIAGHRAGPTLWPGATAISRDLEGRPAAHPSDPLRDRLVARPPQRGPHRGVPDQPGADLLTAAAGDLLEAVVAQRNHRVEVGGGQLAKEPAVPVRVDPRRRVTSRGRMPPTTLFSGPERLPKVAGVVGREPVREPAARHDEDRRPDPAARGRTPAPRRWAGGHDRRHCAHAERCRPRRCSRPEPRHRGTGRGAGGGGSRFHPGDLSGVRCSGGAHVVAWSPE